MLVPMFYTNAVCPVMGIEKVGCQRLVALCIQSTLDHLTVLEYIKVLCQQGVLLFVALQQRSLGIVSLLPNYLGSSQALAYEIGVDHSS